MNPFKADAFGPRYIDSVKLGWHWASGKRNHFDDAGLSASVFGRSNVKVVRQYAQVVTK